MYESMGTDAFTNQSLFLIKKKCDKFNFEPSDCVWLGLSNDDKYKEYFRKGTSIARICLTDYYDS